MKNAFFYSLLLMLVSIPAFSQNKQNEQVIAIVKQAITAQENYDPATLERIYASDYIEISPVGGIDDRDKAIGFYKVADIEKEIARTPRYILDDFRIRYYGKFAMVISKFSVGSKKDSQRPPTPVGIALYGLRKDKGAWKIYSLQLTPFPPQTAPKSNK